MIKKLKRKIFGAKYPFDFSEEHIDIIESVAPYTMTSGERLYALIEATKYIVKNAAPGDIVECGVWKGGSVMAIAKTLMRLDCLSKKIYLFDTFEGMTRPSPVDTSHRNESAAELFEGHKTGEDSSGWCYASIDDVKQAAYSTGYPKDNFLFIKGAVENTLPENAPEAIALLRLDTDWYSSTKHELTHLYPRLSRGGVIIIDDYGYWQGAKKAVDEYIAENNLGLLLTRIDQSARLGVKV